MSQHKHVAIAQAACGATVALLLSACGPAPATAPTPTPVPTPAPTGRFYTASGRIFGPDGAVFVAHGANVNGPGYYFRKDPLENPGPTGLSSLDIATNCWKFNAVRVNTIVGSMVIDQDKLDRIVNAFTARKIVVMIEPHDYTGKYPETQLKTLLFAWTGIAKRYKDNPYVWFNVINEPNAPAGADAREMWVTTHREVIKAIRETGADNLIVVDAHGWGQDFGGGPNSSILNWSRDLTSFDGKAWSNIGFSLHVYELWNPGESMFNTYFDSAAKQGIPLIVGEFGMDNGGRDTLPGSTAMVKAAGPRGIGWFVWHFDGGDTNDLTLPTGGAWEIDDCAKPTNLTTLGRLVWDNAASRQK